MSAIPKRVIVVPGNILCANPLAKPEAFILPRAVLKASTLKYVAALPSEHK